MAKRRQRQEKKFPLPLLALGLVLIMAAAAILFLQNPSGGGTGGTPKLAVQPEKIDYGDVKLDTELTFEFTVTNDGDGVLRFTEQPYIEVLEGC